MAMRIDPALEQIKAGDTVMVATGCYGKWLRKVSRITPTQIVVETGSRFRRSDGRQIGAVDSWNSAWLRIPTVIDIEEVTRKRLIEKLGRLNQKKLAEMPIQDLQSIVSLVT